MSEATALPRLLAYIRARHPRSMPGVLEARAVDPARFDAYGEVLLRWAVDAFGDDAVEQMADAFVGFSMDVNFAQARYEAAGHYENKTYQECHESVYSQKELMNDYLSGIYLTNFLWAHHMDLALFFEQRFVTRLPSSARIVEIASGHGGWGLWVLHAVAGARLVGYDISPSAIEMSSSLARAARLADRARYELRNALDIDPAAMEPADACICSFLIEHLEDPERLMEVIAGLLRPNGTAFLTGALTAAQVDHIFEFQRESELVLLAERHGLRVLDLRSAGPKRTLPNARFLPRSAALVLQKRTHTTW
jgi:2-polyprenyl-3-methyl-5-hydroxy-6-metoxy-1,4-benzoquinol methylase